MTNPQPQSADVTPSYQPGNHYEYYNEQGACIGQSAGIMPQDDLFEQAHYVVVDQDEMIRNQDSQATIQQDIQRYRQELLHVPMSNINRIIELNHLIRNLEKFLVH